MKALRVVLVSAVLLGLYSSAGSAQTSISAGIHVGSSGQAAVDLGFFYDDLADYGNWVQRPSYGWVWHPRAVASTWRPYQSGHWVWTDDGWTWISDEPYGWATYHYGRWYDDPSYGWEWVPGNEWAPAWVSWQQGDDYIGWAALPPNVAFRPGVTLSVSLAPELYVFVPSRQFLATRVADYAVPREQCARIFPRTRNFTQYRMEGSRVFNSGVPVDQVQRFVGRPVPRYQIADLGANDRHQGARITQNRVAIFRPQIQKGNVAPPPERPKAKRAVLAAGAPGNAPQGVTRQEAQQQERVRRQQVAQAAPVPQAQRRNRQQAQQPQARETQRAARAPREEPAPPPQAQQQQRAQKQEAQQQQKAQREAAQQQQRAERQQAQQQRTQQRRTERQQQAQQPKNPNKDKKPSQAKPPEDKDRKPPQL
ncbi:MAG TPA: DUF6600 domain-containing protein [Thermoanaerobaculia bacterium]|nr:DUF6600 domain-containing protein [Thermoanaerobaculia bacterium]